MEVIAASVSPFLKETNARIQLLPNFGFLFMVCLLSAEQQFFLLEWFFQGSLKYLQLRKGENLPYIYMCVLIHIIFMYVEFIHALVKKKKPKAIKCISTGRGDNFE